MTPEDCINLAIKPSLLLLPSRMTSPAAVAMIVAIALQESALKYRRQIRGPARGYWQFELIGVQGVFKHHVTEEMARGIMRILDYKPTPEVAYKAIEHNDVLAAALARLLLWQHPDPLADGRMDIQTGLNQYVKQWRPGRLRANKWEPSYTDAWNTVRTVYRP